MEPQATETTGEQLVSTLDNLRTALKALEDRLDNSGVTRTNGLRESMGRDCTFYRKSLDILLRKDYKDLRSLVDRANNLFLLIEGNTDANS